MMNLWGFLSVLVVVAAATLVALAWLGKQDEAP
jgi:hypothetical protein